MYVKICVTLDFTCFSLDFSQLRTHFSRVWEIFQELVVMFSDNFVFYLHSQRKRNLYVLAGEKSVGAPLPENSRVWVKNSYLRDIYFCFYCAIDQLLKRFSVL